MSNANTEQAMTEAADAVPDVIEVIRDLRVGSEIARRLGITRQAISQWTEVPPTRVLVVAEVTGIPPHLIRPDIYPPPLVAASPIADTSAAEPTVGTEPNRNRKVSPL